LATAHWLATHEDARSPNQAVELAYAWNERKRRFKPEQIHLAWDTMQAKHWLPAKGTVRATSHPDS